jgi:hypothetical protein
MFLPPLNSERVVYTQPARKWGKNLYLSFGFQAFETQVATHQKS